MRINKIIELAKQNPDIAVLWLYGSRAKNSTHANSDYDLAIAFKTFPQDPTERHLRPGILTVEWTHALGIKESILSIVDINLAPISLGLEIVTDGKVLFSADSTRQIKEELRISGRYELDILPHRKRYGNELLHIDDRAYFRKPLISFYH